MGYSITHEREEEFDGSNVELYIVKNNVNVRRIRHEKSTKTDAGSKWMLLDDKESERHSVVIYVVIYFLGIMLMTQTGLGWMEFDPSKTFNIYDKQQWTANIIIKNSLF